MNAVNPVAASEPAPGSRRRTSHILIVDDNRDIVRVLRRILTSDEFEISEAQDGEEALQIARERRPDLLLLDIMLPKKDGLEVCRELKSDPATRGIMVILVTGRASVNHRVQGFEAGADDYVPKPFHVPELFARIRTSLRLKHLTDDLEERNRQLVKSQNDLIRSEKMATIGLLASGIAHEFNNIMAGISAYAQLARRSTVHHDALVNVALTQTERALELTRSLSTYNRVKTDTTHCSVGKVVDDVLCLISKEVQNRSIRITTTLEGECEVQISPGQLQEVLLNLVLNAVQAIDHDQGVIRIRVGPAPNPKVVEIEVIDNGVGIPEENLSRLFDPFFTTKGAFGGGSEHGTGLGLTVCYNIVSSHQGRIEVTSAPGGPTSFLVTLPRSVIPCVEKSAVTRRERRVETAAERSLRILVVDDEETARECLRDFLSAHEVVCCSRVESAIEAYVIQPFDFVILDVCLPGQENGFSAFERFQQFDPPPRIIFASGRFPDEAFCEYIRRAHGHLQKPFRFEELATLLGMSMSSCFLPAETT